MIISNNFYQLNINMNKQYRLYAKFVIYDNSVEIPATVYMESPQKPCLLWLGWAQVWKIH